MTAFRAIQTAVVEMLTAEELRHLAEARDMIERRRADDHVDHLARVMWDKPALGAYRQDHRPPSCPPDAPPTPPPLIVDTAGLVALARGYCQHPDHSGSDYLARRLAQIAARSGLGPTELAAALEVIYAR